MLITRGHAPCGADLSEVSLLLEGRKPCTSLCNGPRIYSFPYQTLYCIEFEQP